MSCFFVRHALLLVVFGALCCAAQSSTPTEQELLRIASVNPNVWQANYDLAEFYFHTGRIAEGVPWMKKAVALKPDNYVAGYDLALAYYELKDWASARGQIVTLLAAQNNADLHALLADVEEDAGNYLKAAAEHQSAAQLDPSEEHIFNWATELIVHQTYQPAIAILARGVAMFPRSQRMNVGLGIALFLDQQYEKAMTELCAATDIDPRQTWPYLILGETYAAQSSRFGTDEVRARLGRFVTAQPNDAKGLYYYAVSLWDDSDGPGPLRDQAEAYLRKAIGQDPSLLDAHMALGILCDNKGDYADAVMQFSEAVRLNPGLTTGHYRLAQAYKRMGETELFRRELDVFRRLHARDTARADDDRNRVAQFIVSMKNGGSSPN